MKDKLEKLIEEGNTFNFANNSHKSSHGTYTRASDKLLSWIANVDDFIREVYGVESGPFRLFESFNRRDLNEEYETAFNKQMAILRGSLLACRELQPKRKGRFSDENLTIALIKNPLFWTVMVIAVATSYTLGLNFGSTRFDKDKNDLYEQNQQLKKELFKIKSTSSKKR